MRSNKNSEKKIWIKKNESYWPIMPCPICKRKVVWEIDYHGMIVLFDPDDGSHVCRGRRN